MNNLLDALRIEFFMENILKSISAILNEINIPRSRSIYIAVSGGSDSVALLHLLHVLVIIVMLFILTIS